jgi:hypothetical protein
MPVARVVSLALDDDTVALVVMAFDEQCEEAGEKEEDAVPVGQGQLYMYIINSCFVRLT